MIRIVSCFVIGLTLNLCLAQELPQQVARVSGALSEDSPSLSADGKIMVFLRSQTDEWPGLVYRQVYSWALDSDQAPAPLGLDSVYSVSMAADASLFLSRRLVNDSTDQVILYQAIPEAGGYQLVNLTERDGLQASYVHQVADGSLYFFQYKGREGTGIYRSQRRGKAFEQPVWQGATLSPPNTTAFSPFLCPDEKHMLLTIFYEEDGEAGRTGIYWARRTESGWEKEQIKNLAYGWSASIDPSGKYLYYTDGEDIYQVAVAALGLPFSCKRP